MPEFTHLLTLTLFFTCALSRTRTYYLGIDRVLWDYYPVSNPAENSGPNADRCTGVAFEEDQLLFVGNGSVWEGGFTPTSVYEKLVFREYTNAGFGETKKRGKEEVHLGLLGPVLRVEKGDTLEVVVRGDVRGAVFGFQVEGFGGVEKVVGKGEVVSFVFEVSREMGGRGDRERFLLYKGAVGGGRDGGEGVYRGLLGGVIVYEKGMLQKSGRELVTILWVGNENSGGEGENEEESNLMHGINGRVFCSLEGLDIVEGQVMTWYLAAVGNEVDVHTAHMHGLVGVDAGGAHTDSVRLLPGSTAVLKFVPDNVGTWLMHCHINDHLHAGMQTLFTVHPSEYAIQQDRFSGVRKRVYYVQAEDEIWDYAPRGRNICDDVEYGDDELVFTSGNTPIDLGGGARIDKGFTIGSTYTKSRYIEYTDAMFTTKVERDETNSHLGLMGPVLRARVGEVIVIHFRNAASEFVSMHPHGVLYSKENEGAPYNDGSSDFEKLDDHIAPGDSYTYRWKVPERAGPGPGERNDSKLWIYHSHRNEIADTYAGLFGPIVIVGLEAEYDDETLLPSDDSREVFLHMSVMNEGESFHLMENILRIEGNGKLTEDQLGMLLRNEEFKESNLMHSINGYVYCNGPMIKLSRGEPTRFYFYSLGTEVDIHTPMIGKEVLRLDVKSSRGSGTLLAGVFSSALVRPRHAGLQEIRCNVNDHVVAGMRGLYFVVDKDERWRKPGGVDVRHFIAADEVEWDYTPLGKNGCTGKTFGEDEKVFTQPRAFNPGSRYVKAKYQEYEDLSFSKLVTGNHTQFSGIVGPLLHFQVGELVEIVFKNKLDFSCNLHIVGLQQISSTLGTTAVPPGIQTTYLFRVRHEAGPSKSDLSSTAYVYYSSVDAISHTAAGLSGVIAVTIKGGLKKRNRLPKGTTIAIPLLFNIFRENESPLLEKSLHMYSLKPDNITEILLDELAVDDDWLESNTMHSVNGFLYANNPTINVKIGTTIRFYVFGFGSEASMHSPVWNGQVVSERAIKGNLAAGVQILPFNVETVDVILVTKGKWPIICGVTDHEQGGMRLCMRVY